MDKNEEATSRLNELQLADAPFRRMLSVLVDVWDDGQQEQEAHSYVPGTWKEVLKEARTLLAQNSEEGVEHQASNQGLLPCPFCGGEAEFDHDDGGYHWIFCKKCGCATDTDRYYGDTDCRVRLAAGWNKRTPPRQG